MVLLKMSSGLANSMLEYAAGYALASELGQELVLDISEYENSIWPFLLDQLQIDKCIKIIYSQTGCLSHEDINSIDSKIRSDSYILVENKTIADEGIYYYDDLENKEWRKLIKEKNLYLCGYFFNKKYYSKFWEKIKEQFQLSKKYIEISCFENLIANKVSVGVHIRRGDMLFADWAEKMEADYYRAAIAWYGKKLGSCIFCVFSDDLKYAKEIIGNLDDVYYIDMLGYDDADLFEFICLSKCSHRILSNSSTYSRLADELNGGRGRIVFRKGTGTDLKMSDRLSYFLFRHVKWYDNKGTGARHIDLMPKEIKKYNRLFKENAMPSKKRNMIEELLNSSINEKNAEGFLEKMWGGY